MSETRFEHVGEMPKQESDEKELHIKSNANQFSVQRPEQFMDESAVPIHKYLLDWASRLPYSPHPSDKLVLFLPWGAQETVAIVAFMKKGLEV